MRGRKPTPTAKKILLGNPGHRPISGDEPKPDPSIPDPPEKLLGVEGKKEWDRLTAELGKVGLLTQLERGVLAAYCVAFEDWIVARRMIAAKGRMLLSREGVLYQSPYVHQANRAVEQMTKLGQLLGLDPSSRTRLHVAPKEDNDPMREFMT